MAGASSVAKFIAFVTAISRAQRHFLFNSGLGTVDMISEDK